MLQIFLTDAELRDQLFPFTLTRSAADIRVGILTIRQKWEAYLGRPLSVMDDDTPANEDATILSAGIIPSAAFVRSLIEGDRVKDTPDWSAVRIIQYPWHIFTWNDWAIRQDYALLTAGRDSAPLPPGVQVTGAGQVFIEAGARLSFCTINAENGPVYIGKEAEIMEGALLRGPVAVCERAVIKMGARIYGATTVGPYCQAGGEIKNAVLFGYSNKSHDGYLGDSVVGEWCNIGAGTSNSNLKNNAGQVSVWNPASGSFVATGTHKCGLIMGDYSRAAINTSFNTGTVVGVCANVFGGGLTPRFIPNFAWGAGTGVRYEFDRALVDIENWKKLKGASLTAQEKSMLKRIFDQN